LQLFCVCSKYISNISRIHVHYASGYRVALLPQVLKVSQHTSLTALLMGDLILAAGLPEGVVNILTGPGATLGDAMAQHPGVDKVGTVCA
jgi:delta 1-pyrroline-5-carboxylate dehydrogenase